MIICKKCSFFVFFWTYFCYCFEYTVHSLEKPLIHQCWFLRLTVKITNSHFCCWTKQSASLSFSKYRISHYLVFYIVFCLFTYCEKFWSWSKVTQKTIFCCWYYWSCFVIFLFAKICIRSNPDNWLLLFFFFNKVIGQINWGITDFFICALLFGCSSVQCYTSVSNFHRLLKLCFLPINLFVSDSSPYLVLLLDDSHLLLITRRPQSRQKCLFLILI